METNNFFEAFNESSRLEEAGVVGTMAKNAVNKVGNKIANSKLGQKVKNSKPAQAVSNAVANAKDQVNQQNANDANNFAETYKALKGEDGKSGILGELQAIANESIETPPKYAPTIIKMLWIIVPITPFIDLCLKSSKPERTPS
jgi:hypothetical protein